MKKLSIVLSLLLIASIALAQNVKRTKGSTPLKGTYDFLNPDRPNYNPSIIHLDQYPTPYSDGAQSKAAANARRAQLAGNEFSNKRTRGAAPNPEVIKTWVGNFASGVPMDNDVAISDAGIVMSAVNSNIRVFDSSGANISGQAISAMDSVTGLFNWISDPRLLYDPNADRFILTCFSGNTSATSNIILGFSTTNNPVDPWNFYLLDGSPFNDSTWSDYPIISISDKDYFLTINHIIDNIGWQNGFKESVIYQIKKDDGYNGAASLNYDLWSNLNYNGVNYRNICPAKNNETSMGDDMYFVSVRNVDVANDTVFLLHIDDSYQSTNAQYSQQVLISPVTYGMPPNPPMPNGNYLMTNDGRVLSAIYENDMIHFAGNSIDPTTAKAGILVGEISNLSSSPSVSFADVYDEPNVEFGYPSMTLMGHIPGEHRVMYTFSHRDADGFPGTSVIYKNPNGFSDRITIKDGNTSLNALTDTFERWGDYSGIQVMYSDPTKACLVGSYTLQGGYRTAVAMVGNGEHPTSVQDLQEETSMDVYPNPMQDRFSTKFTLKEKEQIHFKLYDMNGRLTKLLLIHPCKVGLNEFSFNLSALSSGNYVFSMEGEAGLKKREIITIE